MTAKPTQHSYSFVWCKAAACCVHAAKTCNLPRLVWEKLIPHRL